MYKIFFLIKVVQLFQSNIKMVMYVGEVTFRHNLNLYIISIIVKQNYNA